MCRTVLGVMPCATTVSADFGRSIARREAWPRVQATLALGVLTMSGTVPDDASRLAARDAASEGIHAGRVERYSDGLVAEGLLSRPGSQALVRRLIRALSHCSDGSATIDDGLVSVDCRLTPGAVARVRRILASPLPAGELTALDLTEIHADDSEETAAR